MFSLLPAVGFSSFGQTRFLLFDFNREGPFPGFVPLLLCETAFEWNCVCHREIINLFAAWPMRPLATSQPAIPI